MLQPAPQDKQITLCFLLVSSAITVKLIFASFFFRIFDSQTPCKYHGNMVLSPQLHTNLNMSYLPVICNSFHFYIITSFSNGQMVPLSDELILYKGLYTSFWYLSHMHKHHRQTHMLIYQKRLTICAWIQRGGVGEWYLIVWIQYLRLLPYFNPKS